MNRGVRVGSGRRPTNALRGAILLVIALLASGCEHPIAIVSAHIEAADLDLIGGDGSRIARTEFNRIWSVEAIHLQDQDSLRITIVPIDFRGDAIDLSKRADITFRMEAEQASLLQWEPKNGFGWLRPFGIGTTRVRFMIWHETHPDFISPWLTVTVLPRTTPSATVSGDEARDL